MPGLALLLYSVLVAPPASQEPPGPAPAPPASQAPTGQQPSANVDEAEALKLALRQALAADSAPEQSVDHLNQRIERWSMVLLLAPPGSPEAVAAQAGVAQARSDLQAARSREFGSGLVDDATRGIFDAKLAAARDFLSVKDWALADENIRYVLDRSPADPAALSLLAELERKRGSSDELLLIAATAALLLAVGLVGVLVIRLGLRHRDARRGEAARTAASAGATLEIVEGVGRGKTVSIATGRPTFRIGAATGDRGGERNDLIVSDSAKAMSRFHCSLLRSGGDYYLVDTSSNGTFVNGKRLAKGEHRLLRHEDEIILAEVARLTFRCR